MVLLSRYIITHKGVAVPQVQPALMNNRAGPVLVGSEQHFKTADHPAIILVCLHQCHDPVGSVAIEQAIGKNYRTPRDLVRDIPGLTGSGIYAVPLLFTEFRTVQASAMPQ